jgi:hypothetical protein
MTPGLAENKLVYEEVANSRTAEPLLSWWLSKSAGELPVGLE